MAEARQSTAAPAVPVPGSDARSPRRIPARGWASVVRRAVRHVTSDRLQVLSAGISFFAILSIAPVLVTALSVYGAVNTPQEALDQLSRLTGLLPAELEPPGFHRATAQTHSRSRMNVTYRLQT